MVFPGLMEIGHILLSHQSNADFALPFSKYIFELGAWLVRACGLSSDCNLIAGVETREMRVDFPVSWLEFGCKLSHILAEEGKNI